MMFVSLFFCAFVTVTQSQTVPQLTIKDLFDISQLYTTSLYNIITKANSSCGYNFYCLFCSNPDTTTKDMFIALNPGSLASLYSNIVAYGCPVYPNTLFDINFPRPIFNAIVANWCKLPYATCEPTQPDPNVLTTYASCAIGQAVRYNQYAGAKRGPCDSAVAPTILRYVQLAGFDSTFVSKFNSSLVSICYVNGNTTNAANEYDVATKTICTVPGITCEPSCPLPALMSY